MRNLISKVFFIAVLAAPQTNATAYLQSKEAETMASFYKTLETITSQAPDRQIAAVQSFIMAFPKFERAYQWVLKLYIIEDELGKAKGFFSQLRHKEPFVHNSEWMLAKIYATEDSIGQAMASIRRAAAQTRPSPELLIDILNFEKKLKRSGSKVSLAENKIWDPDTREFAKALSSYINLDFYLAREQFKRLPSGHREQLAILYARGFCNRRLQNTIRADSLWQVGVRKSREENELEYLTKFLTGIGIIHNTSHNSEIALRYYDLADSIATSIGDLHRMEYLAGNRALLYQDRGDFAMAEVLLQNAIGIADMLKSNPKLAIWYSHYGRLLHGMDNFAGALRCFDLSGEFASKVNDERKSLQSLIDRGDLYRDLGQTKLALNHYYRAYNAANSKHLIEFTRLAQEGMAEIFYHAGEYEKASAILTEYIESASDNTALSRIRSHWFLKRGRIRKAQKRLELAKVDFQLAYEFADRLGNDYFLLWSRIGLAETELALGDLSAAAINFEKCRQMSIVKGDSSTLPTIYLGLGNVARKSGEWQPAIEHYKKAASIIEVTRKGQYNPYIRQQYFSNTAKVYDGLAQCYSQLHKETKQSVYLDSLVQVMERTRARALVEVQRQRALQAEDDSPQSARFRQARNQLRRKQRGLRSRVARILAETELDSLVSEIEVSRSSLIAQSLRLQDTPVEETEEVALNRLQQQTQERGFGWLLYHVSEDAAFALVVTSEETRLVHLPITAEELERQVRELVSPFYELRPETLHKTPFKAGLAHRLYEQIFAPVAQAVDLPPNLVIVPDIELMNLPFEMLLINQPVQDVFMPQDKPVYANDFLQHDYAITYSPSTQLVKETSSWRLGNPDMLVYANPLDEDQGESQSANLLTAKNAVPVVPSQSSLRTLRMRIGWRLEPLPFSQVEGERIGEIEPSATLRLQTKATESAFLNEASDYDIIHIAGHGFADSTQDAFSGLVLAAGSDTTQDGLLMGYEISDLRLDCDLVTLSACESGRGKPLRGEGILGLPRLFLSAGAKSVLMTMWQVDDLFSSQLMPKFYQTHLADNQSASMALASARRELLKNIDGHQKLYYQHPVFWAPYQLYGDPGQVRTNMLPRLLWVGLLTSLLVFLVARFRLPLARSLKGPRSG